jgi:hypothetical protein
VGTDYKYDGELAGFAQKFHYGTTPNDPDSRPADLFGGRVALHAGGGRDAYLLLPVIPPVA